MLKKVVALLTLSICILFLSVPIFPGGTPPKSNPDADPWDDVQSPGPSNGSVVQHRLLIVRPVSLIPQVIIITAKGHSSTFAVTKGKNSGEAPKGALSSSRMNKK